MTTQTDTQKNLVAVGHQVRQEPYAVALTRAFFGLSASARTPSSQSAVSSSSICFAYINSEARIFFAFTNICFSPVERPFSWSRSERLRTTSASSKMSPVFILSRLCLKRRVPFFWLPGGPPARGAGAFLFLFFSLHP